MPPENNPEEKVVEKENLPIKSLRTYQGDVEEAVTKNNYSSSSIFLAEQKRRDQTLLNPEQGTDKEARNKFFLLVGGILLLLGIITVVSVYYIKSNQQVVIEKQTKALIGFSEEKIMPIANSTREELVTNIISEKQSFSLPVNSVLYINAVSGSSTPADLFLLLSILAPNIPPSLERSFDSQYMLGIYSFDTNEPFIILTTSDFVSSYAGMLKWEENMSFDLGKLFSIQQNASTTTRIFTDQSLKNKDLRVLREASGKTVLLYSFIDKNTLLITTNENIFSAILGKYLVNKQVR